MKLVIILPAYVCPSSKRARVSLVVLSISTYFPGLFIQIPTSPAIYRHILAPTSLPTSYSCVTTASVTWLSPHLTLLLAPIFLPHSRHSTRCQSTATRGSFCLASFLLLRRFPSHSTFHHFNRETVLSHTVLLAPTYLHPLRNLLPLRPLCWTVSSRRWALVHPLLSSIAYPLHLLPVKLGVNICMHESAMNDEDRMNYSLELLWTTLIGHTH